MGSLSESPPFGCAQDKLKTAPTTEIAASLIAPRNDDIPNNPTSR